MNEAKDVETPPNYTSYLNRVSDKLSGESPHPLSVARFRVKYMRENKPTVYKTLCSSFLASLTKNCIAASHADTVVNKWARELAFGYLAYARTELSDSVISVTEPAPTLVDIICDFRSMMTGIPSNAMFVKWVLSH